MDIEELIERIKEGDNVALEIKMRFSNHMPTG